uniref:DNA-directed RNA polymerase n=1 Tax=Lacunastrum gracillimum TaxID=427913 RepID=A0A2U8GIF1_9CHLO|nr:alpha subunit of RNA polymerase [Lacunastrum gracillimum]AWI68030.1 alpha subunit of RNA polymerase [Lacunastrum gracillimum]
MTNFFLTCKECILESPTNFYGCFYLGPFNSSQSLTVANGLRRTLLSEIPGLGIQSIEIESVEHEFCTFPGIRESILDLLLNFKEIVLKYNNEQKETFESQTISNKNGSINCINSFNKVNNKKPLYGYLQARGPGIIRASDLKLPASVISVDPNQYIATLTTDGFLNLRFTICEGFTNIQNKKIKYNQINKNLIEDGFSWLFENEKDQIMKEPKEQAENAKNIKHLENNVLRFASVRGAKKPKQTEVAVNQSRSEHKEARPDKKIFKNSKILWLDPLFTPILKVNYIIESYGSLELKPTNQVILLELWTNGSMHPRDALYAALSELNLVFSKLEQMKILNSIFAKSILKENKFYSKILKKVKYDYNFYKSENLKKLKNKENNLLHCMSSEIAKEANINERKDLKNYTNENICIDSLSLPFRIKNSLKNANIISIQHLLNYQIEDLKKIPGIGNQSLILLIKKLNEKGLKLKR